MGLAWEEKLSVESTIIDSDHKRLMDLVNSIERAVRARDCSTISQAFELLEYCLRIHSENEDKIAQAIKFDASKYKPAQQYSLKEFEYLKNDLVAKEGNWCESAIEHHSHSLRRWLTEHIIKVDMPMKPTLQALGYNFRPGREKGKLAMLLGTQ